MIDKPGLVVAAALACLIVGACERKPDERAKAAGEVLEGTVSDAMIAPDRVHSEPPIAPPRDAPGGTNKPTPRPAPNGEPDPTPPDAPTDTPGRPTPMPEPSLSGGPATDDAL